MNWFLRALVILVWAWIMLMLLVFLNGIFMSLGLGPILSVVLSCILSIGCSITAYRLLMGAME